MPTTNRCKVTGLRWHVHSRSRATIPPEANLSIDVSLNNKFCTGNFFQCTVLALMPDFARIEISLGDTLLRHNLPSAPTEKVEIEKERAWREGRRLGDYWLHENQRTIEELSNAREVQIIRWNQWEKNTRVMELARFYRDLIDRYEELQIALSADIDRFAESALKNGNDLDRGSLASYVLEELAVYHFQAQSAIYFHAYVGSELKILRALRRHESTPVPLKYHDYIYLDIRR